MGILAAAAFHSRKCAGMVLVLATAIFHSAVSNGQSIPDLEFEECPIHSLSEDIGSLIRLNWSGRNIALLKEWPGSEDNSKKRIQSLIDRGINREAAERIAKTSVFDQPIMNAFQAIGQRRRFARSGSGSTGEKQTFRLFGPELEAMCQTVDESVRIQFLENREGGHRFFFDDPEGLPLSMLYLADGLVVDFRQDSKGQIRVSIIDEDPVLIQADDYQSLVDDEPILMAQVLDPLFTHLGISALITKRSSRVKTAALTALAAMGDKDFSMGQEWVDMLDAESEKDRKLAYQRLMEGFEAWREPLEALVDDETISSATKSLLQQLQTNGPNSPVNSFIKDRKLLSSPSFLITVLSESVGVDRELVIDHLNQLAGESFGDDLELWKTWLRDQ